MKAAWRSAPGGAASLKAEKRWQRRRRGVWRRMKINESCGNVQRNVAMAAMSKKVAISVKAS